MLSCEHAGHTVPPAYRYLFARDPAALATHRGYDIGIAPVARQVAQILGVPLIACRTSRLLIEANRSLRHRDLFSPFSRHLPAADKARLIADVWKPHREAVRGAVAERIGRGRPVLHLALHSFTPMLNGQVRTADIGLLYDPQRPPERHLALSLQRALHGTTGLRVRRNYPYRGSADGLTTSLRHVFGSSDYLGFEIELNQRLLSGPAAQRANLARALCEAVRRTWLFE